MAPATLRPEQPPRPWRRGLAGIAGPDASIFGIAQSVAIVVVGWLTIRPVDAVTVPLLVVSSALILSRHLPVRVIPDDVRFGLLVLAALVSAALVAEARHGSSYLFAFYVAGHAGFRLATTRALVIAGLTSLANGGVLLLHWGPGHLDAPWGVGAATGGSVLIGMISRSERLALDSALEAAASAERAAEAEAREAVAAERGRIARDVHDVLAHSLAGINMQLEVADALLEAGKVAEARAATRRAQSLVRESLVESQRTVRALREDALPLVETLRAMHPGDFTVTGLEREVETRVAQNLIRMAQEAITNAGRHAPGAAVAVGLSYEEDLLVLDIVNGPATGVVTAAVGSGMGLVGLRERAALLGGTVAAGPGPDGGWAVRAMIPS